MSFYGQKVKKITMLEKKWNIHLNPIKRIGSYFFKPKYHHFYKQKNKFSSRKNIIQHMSIVLFFYTFRSIAINHVATMTIKFTNSAKIEAK